MVSPWARGGRQNHRLKRPWVSLVMAAVDHPDHPSRTPGVEPEPPTAWSLGDGRVTSNQVGLVGVAAQVGADERTERDELEPTGAEVLQGAGDQPLAQPLALEGG